MTFGQFLWNYNGQTFKFDRQLGLCQDCKEIVAMEDLPEPHEFEEAKKLHPELCGQFVNPFTASYARQLASREGFEVLERVMELRRPPVCLKCGRSDVQPLLLPKVAKLTDIELTGLKVRHPACSGRLMVEGSGSLRMALQPVTYFYTIYGRALATLHKANGPVLEPAPPRTTIKTWHRSQVWRPDWVVFEEQSKAIEITFEEPELDIVLSNVDVVEETDGCFRIYSYAFSDVLHWGVLFEGRIKKKDSIHFVRLLDRPNYLHFGGYYPAKNSPIPPTQEEWYPRFPHLQRAVDEGGFWEYNELTGLYIAIPEECLKYFPEFDDEVPLILEKPS